MGIRTISIIAGFVVIAAEGGAQSQGALPSDSLTRARAYTRWFVNGETDSLWAVVVPGGSGPLSTRDALAGAQADFGARAGEVGKVLEERFVWRQGMRQFWTTMNASSAPEPVVVRWVLRPDGRIQGIGLSLASSVPATDSGGPVIKP